MSPLSVRQLVAICLTIAPEAFAAAGATKPATPAAEKPSILVNPVCVGEDIIRGSLKQATPGRYTDVQAQVFRGGFPVASELGLIREDLTWKVPLDAPLQAESILVVILRKNNAEVTRTVPLLICSSAPPAPRAGSAERSAAPVAVPAPVARRAQEAAPVRQQAQVASRREAAPAQDEPEPAPEPAPCAPGDMKNGYPGAALSDIPVGQTAITGNAPFAGGTVSLCVDGELRELSDAAAKDDKAPFANSKYTLTPKDPLTVNNKLRVIFVSEDGKNRRSADAVVIDPCLSGVSEVASGAASIGDLRAGDRKFSGETSLDGATLSACVNGVPAKFEDGKSSVALDAKKFSVTLFAPLKFQDRLRVVLTGKDKKRYSTDISTINSCDKEAVEFRIRPKEGENTVYGHGAKSTATAKCMIGVFLNGDAVQLVNAEGGSQWALPTSEDGAFLGRLRESLDAGQCVTLVQFNEGQELKATDTFREGVCPGRRSQHIQNALLPASGATPSAVPPSPNVHSETVQSFLNFGRMRSYFAAGTVLSTEGQNFIRPDLFLAFNVNKNWLWGGPQGTLGRGRSRNPQHPTFDYDDKNQATPVKADYRRLMIDTFFEARLTAIPAVVVCTEQDKTKCQSTPAAGGSTPTSTVDTFLASRKAATLQAGFVAPYVVTTWTHSGKPHAFSIGPLAKIGFQTPIDTVDQNGNTVSNPASRQFYVWQGFGSRVGFHQMSADKNVAPDLISYIDVVMGRFSNFDSDPLRIIRNTSRPGSAPNGCPMDQTPGNSMIPACMYERYARPWRLGIEGIFKVPNAPLILGFSANVRQNLGIGNSKTVDHTRDDLRFFIGTKFNIGTLTGKLKRLDDQLPSK